MPSSCSFCPTLCSSQWAWQSSRRRSAPRSWFPGRPTMQDTNPGSTSAENPLDVTRTVRSYTSTARPESGCDTHWKSNLLGNKPWVALTALEQCRRHQVQCGRAVEEELMEEVGHGTCVCPVLPLQRGLGKKGRGGGSTPASASQRETTPGTAAPETAPRWHDHRSGLQTQALEMHLHCPPPALRPTLAADGAPALPGGATCREGVGLRGGGWLSQP